MMLQREKMERDKLNHAISLVQLEVEKSLQELNAMKYLRNENDTIHSNIESELDVPKAKCEESKHSLYEDELEKETLRRRVVQLKSDLTKKEDALSTMERKLKDNNGSKTFGDMGEAAYRSTIPEPVQCGPREFSTLSGRIKLLEEQIKEKETIIGNSTSSFLEKEKDLLDKIEERENRRTEDRQRSTSSPNDATKVSDNGENECHEESSKIMEIGNPIPTISSSGQNAFREQHEIATMLNMAFLKERNNSMEKELKEMQERYSEISLKFAEVEGERQQLVMTLRNLKNSKKC